MSAAAGGPASGRGRPSVGSPRPGGGGRAARTGQRAQAGTGQRAQSGTGQRTGDVRPARGAQRGTGARSRPAQRRAQPRRAAVTVVGGTAWTVLVLGALGVAAIATVVVLVPVAVLAAASGVRALEAGRPAGKRARRRGPISALGVTAVVGAVAVPVAALAGPVAAGAGVVVLAVAVLAVGGPAPAGKRSDGPPARLGPAASRVVVAVGPALASMSVVLARHQGPSGALALLAATLAFDAGAFMMGDARTATGGAVGVVFGLVSVAVVAVFVAAMMNPPFSGNRPWAVFAVVGAAAAAGVWLCDRAVGGVRYPALRRLDSLTLAAPAWVISLAVIGYH